mmetsp:Transcript_8004/g.15076  ORF Transcript_8004/g.15076 Transcript_8004/m.15076 type:complete len:282 (-) Transcript_8004:173-1018(-)
MSRRSHTNHTRSTPTSMSTFQRSTHHLCISCAIKGIIDSPRGEFSSNVTLHWFVQLGSIDNIRRSHLDGSREFTRVDIHSDNFRSTRHLGSLNDCQPNCSETKHCHGGIYFHLTRIPNSSKSRTHSTTKETNLIQGRTLVNLGATNFCQYGILTHGRTSHKVINWIPIMILESYRSIGHDTLSLRRTDFRTKIGLGGLTKDTLCLTALGSVAGYDVITRCDGSDTLSDGFDDASGFMAQDTGKESLGIAAVQGINICMTKSICDHFDSHFSRPWGVDRDGF